jgi:hypothetical protein
LPSIVCRTCLTSPRWRATTFSAGGRQYQWLDVFLAAMLRGHWQAFERRLLGGLACVVAADADGTRPDDARVDAEAATFRYDRDLLTAEETTRWLEGRGLDVEAWTDFLVRDILLRDRAGQIDELIQAHLDAIAITDAAFVAEGLCSNVFQQLSTTLAGRAAVAVARRGTRPSPSRSELIDIERVVASNLPWIEALDRADTVSRLTHAAHLEVVFQDEASAALTERALTSELVRHQMDWMRIDLERLSFGSAAAAREALLCIREDGFSFDDVAQESRLPVRDSRDLLEQLEPEWRDVVLSAGVEEVLGPVGVGDRFEIALLVAKRPASLDDPLVRARAEEAVVEHLVSRAVLAHVRHPAP